VSDAGADGAAILGHLAHRDRRRVIAALVLGATTVDEIKSSTGLGTRAVVSALGRLVESGIVLNDDERHWLVEEVFRQAAIASRPPVTDEHGDAPAESARVLRSFVRDGRLVSIPMQRAKRLVILDLLAQDFEPGRRYKERTVNTKLRRWHEDTAALRRYLVDEGFLDRDRGEYWRTGGSVEV
jgi:hypothetical protein